MMDKQLRHDLIKKAVQENKIASQSDLVTYLAQEGYPITQATVSRDISELHLIKVADAQGAFYQLPQVEQLDRSDAALTDLLTNVGARLYRQDNLINIEVAPGSGIVVANAIKQRRWSEVFTVVGTDDSTLLVLKSDDLNNRDLVWDRLSTLLN
ncbi:arginine repressor [Lapidilactobacillus bayanensis]|uniref:arginine repressor n=1 Tax=Lapidilactobacillus bayanensis TaxID=2485998 RepID=UPI000F777646|nr:hypothetical protein [Lapidilactobacillus bayanensis]